jgi:dTDP-4-dehydrorhamnose 3,5-epimerase
MSWLTGHRLADVMIQSLAPNVDERGAFVDIFKSGWNPSFVPRQWSVVRSHANVLRGPHFHLEHDEYFLLLEGKAFVGLRDIRPDSPTRDRSCLIEVDGSFPEAIVFPRGFVHGWYFATESLHVQSVSDVYERYHAHDNLGVLWSDPALEIPWPCSDPILSARAATFPLLSALLERVFATAEI